MELFAPFLLSAMMAIAGLALLLRLRTESPGRKGTRIGMLTGGLALAVLGCVALLLLVLTVLPEKRADVFAPRTDPDSLLVQSVIVTRSSVRIAGSTTSSALKFEDYIARYSPDGTIEIGMDYTLVRDETDSGAFDITLDALETSPTSVWLVGAGQRRRVY